MIYKQDQTDINRIITRRKEQSMAERKGNAAKIYEDGTLAGITGETLRPGGFELTRQAIDFCRLPAGAKILDVGCGTGATVRLLREEYGFEATGLDASGEMLRQARERNPRVPFIKGSGDNIPLQNGEMDCILMECSFSLIPDAGLALAESYRVLNNRGKLIISDFYYRKRPGVIDRQYFEELLEEHEFLPCLWEDKTHYLTQLVVQSIMNEKDPDILWQCLLCKDENKGLTKEDVKKFKPGYFLLVAEKTVR
ncbi:MAG TPA: class I SAM-dependent methyltransferase [Firmicutes bacterium]|jgi:ubiquinone/menaquinone biosynthesis C-methylase UbiE|nr:class I SAM-dependent methyltransferase [Bacillota bacterium]